MFLFYIIIFDVNKYCGYVVDFFVYIYKTIMSSVVITKCMTPPPSVICKTRGMRAPVQCNNTRSIGLFQFLFTAVTYRNPRFSEHFTIRSFRSA